MACFAELNLPTGDNSCQSYEAIRSAIKLGYETICINNYVEQLSVKTGKKVKDKDKVVTIKLPHEVLLSSQLFESFIDEHKVLARHRPKQYSRFTGVFSDLSQSLRLKEVQRYDVVAVQPTNQKVFVEACKTYSIDLISLDLSQRLDSMLFGKPARAAVGCAISRGVHFEIIYSPMIRDAAARRSTITNANLLVELCRGKNIVISSGTNKAIEMRGPYDMTHLGVLFGLTLEQSRRTVTDNCRAVILHGVARKSANGVVSCCKIESLPESERWKVLSSSAAEAESTPADETSQQIQSSRKRRKLS